jgi:hypothetical protein
VGCRPCSVSPFRSTYSCMWRHAPAHLHASRVLRFTLKGESAARATEMWGCFSASIFVATQVVARPSEPLFTVGVWSASNGIRCLTPPPVAPQLWRSTASHTLPLMLPFPLEFNRATYSKSRRPSVCHSLWKCLLLRNESWLWHWTVCYCSWSPISYPAKTVRKVKRKV